MNSKLLYGEMALDFSGRILLLDDIKPSERELRLKLLEDKIHVYNVEYFLHKLGVNPMLKDPQRPHDLCGPGNKLEKEVLFGLAMRFHPDYDANKELFDERYIFPAREIHRKKQYHHQIFRSPDEDIDENSVHPENIDWIIGAVDAVCAQYENRRYNGGHHSFSEILEKFREKPLFKTFICTEMLCEMEQIGFPELRIESILDVPKIESPDWVFEKSEQRFAETLSYLTQMKYNRDLLTSRTV